MTLQYGHVSGLDVVVDVQGLVECHVEALRLDVVRATQLTSAVSSGLTVDQEGKWLGVGRL